MYIIPVTLKNLHATGILSGEKHLNNYVHGMKEDKFSFHTIYAELPHREKFYAASYYKEDIEKVMDRAERELSSHSLKPVWGDAVRVSVGESRRMFGWKY